MAEYTEEEQTRVNNMIDDLVQKAKKASEEYMKLNQEQVNNIVKAMAMAGLEHHMELAKLAVEETGRGIYEDKITKNMFATEYIYHSIKYDKTVGVINENEEEGYEEIAEPIGIIAGVTPVTNPTSTTMFKSIIAAKTRNVIIFGFHPSAQKCSSKAAEIVRDAAIKAGAPENCILWIEEPSILATSTLMHHPGVNLILATGGTSMVKAAYSSGKPALGVGPGNVPCYIHKSAKLKTSVNDLVLSKSFDNGMICASEQAVIIDKEIYDESKKMFERFGVYFVTKKEDKAKLEKFTFGYEAYSEGVENAKLNASIVGQSAKWIAEQAGIKVPDNTVILAVPCKKVGPEEPLTREKLSPVLAVLKSSSFDEGVALAEAMVNFNGLGHSAAIHTASKELSEIYGDKVKAMRIIWNSPSTFGGIGNVYNSFLPSLTLGCGSYGHNSIGGNVSAVNLINVKKVGKRRNTMQWFKVPRKIYFERNSIQYLHDMQDVSKVFIVTDRSMVDLGYINRVTDQLNARRNPVQIQLFCDVEPDPDIETVKKGVSLMNAFKPDTIIALGGGSPMDAAKGMWLFYEHPEVNFDDLKQKFMDIRKRAIKYPELGQKSKLICIPTTSGTGSEVSPFAVISDKKHNKKYPLADYSLTPTIAIIDPEFTTSLPPRVTAMTGMDVLTHAIEAYTSALASDYTDGLALQAIELVFEYLPRAVKDGKNDPEAREKMHNASAIAGMAFANAFLGMNHSMAHKIGGMFHVPHGYANAILLPYTIRYNGATPSKLTVWPKYNVYNCDKRYQRIARLVGLKADTPEEGVEALANAVKKLGEECGLELNFKAAGVDEKEWMDKIEEMAYLAFEDQCSPCNARVPMVEDMKEIMRKAYLGIEK